MAKRHAQEKILVKWTIDETCWHRFKAASEARRQQRDRSYVIMQAPDPFPPAGIEVVIREDAIFIGKKCACEFVYNGGTHWMSIHDSWLEMGMSSDSGFYEYQIPIAPAAFPEAKRVVDDFIKQDFEAARVQAEKDARPTFINGLRRWVEAHALLTIIGFFVVVLPLFVLAMALLFPD